MSDNRDYSWKKVGPSGVSESDKEKNNGWGHRSEISPNPEQGGASAEVNNRKYGEVEIPSYVEEDDPSEIHPDHDEMSVAEKYRRKYSKYWGPETKEMAKQLYKERGNEWA